MLGCSPETHAWQCKKKQQQHNADVCIKGVVAQVSCSFVFLQLMANYENL